MYLFCKHRLYWTSKLWVVYHKTTSVYHKIMLAKAQRTEIKVAEKIDVSTIIRAVSIFWPTNLKRRKRLKEQFVVVTTNYRQSVLPACVSNSSKTISQNINRKYRNMNKQGHNIRGYIYEGRQMKCSAMRWVLWELIVLLDSGLSWSRGVKRDVGSFEDNSIEDDYGDFLNYFFILPGTKWCGSGNVAADENDLGNHAETDACCRAHDMCDDIIEAGGTKHGLTNHAPYTRLHCDCDDQFLMCLRNATDDKKTSQVVGSLYFNMIRTSCFKYEHQTSGCDDYNTIALRCEKYTIDPSTPKTWQWFDVPVYHL